MLAAVEEVCCDLADTLDRAVIRINVLLDACYVLGKLIVCAYRDIAVIAQQRKELNYIAIRQYSALGCTGCRCTVCRLCKCAKLFKHDLIRLKRTVTALCRKECGRCKLLTAIVKKVALEIEHKSLICAVRDKTCSMHGVRQACHHHTGKRLENIVFTNVLHLAGNIEYYLVVIMALKALIKCLFGIIIFTVRKNQAVMNKLVLPTVDA